MRVVSEYPNIVKVRLSDEQLLALENRASDQGVTRSDLIRAAIEKLLGTS